MKNTHTNQKSENIGVYIIGGLILLIGVLCAASPAFAVAVFRIFECAIYTCVKVVP
jgi:uncharacterized membrane protein HdeD (DUF308 family)